MSGVLAKITIDFLKVALHAQPLVLLAQPADLHRSADVCVDCAVGALRGGGRRSCLNFSTSIAARKRAERSPSPPMLSNESWTPPARRPKCL